MDKSENLKEVELLYLQICRQLKQSGSREVSLPTRKSFLHTLKIFKNLLEGHQSLLIAIGKL